MSERRDIPDALRDAVERTMQATVGTRELAQGKASELSASVDELVKGAEKGLTRSGRSVRAAVEERLPATQDDVKAIRAELRRLGKRLEAIEERLAGGSATRRGAPAKAVAKPAAKAKPGSAAKAKPGSAAKAKPKPAAKAKPKRAAEAKPKPAAKAKPKRAAKAKPKPAAKAKPKRAAEAKPKRAAKAKPAANAKPRSAARNKPQR